MKSLPAHFRFEHSSRSREDVDQDEAGQFDHGEPEEEEGRRRVRVWHPCAAQCQASLVKLPWWVTRLIKVA